MITEQDVTDPTDGFELPPAIACQFQSGFFAVRKALIEAGAKMASADVDPDLAETAQIVLAEVLNNVAEHAYGNAEGGPVALSIWPTVQGLWCETRDEGVGMPNGQLPDGALPEIDVDDPMTLPEGGFGWAMVRQATDQLSYRRLGSENRLRFLIPAQ